MIALGFILALSENVVGQSVFLLFPSQDRPTWPQNQMQSAQNTSGNIEHNQENTWKLISFLSYEYENQTVEELSANISQMQYQVQPPCGMW